MGKDSKQYRLDFLDHPSIQTILTKVPQNDPDQKFSFKLVEEKYVHKNVTNFNVKKAT